MHVRGHERAAPAVLPPMPAPPFTLQAAAACRCRSAAGCRPCRPCSRRRRRPADEGRGALVLPGGRASPRRRYRRPLSCSGWAFPEPARPFCKLWASGGHRASESAKEAASTAPCELRPSVLPHQDAPHGASCLTIPLTRSEQVQRACTCGAGPAPSLRKALARTQAGAPEARRALVHSAARQRARQRAQRPGPWGRRAKRSVQTAESSGGRSGADRPRHNRQGRSPTRKRWCACKGAGAHGRGCAVVHQPDASGTPAVACGRRPNPASRPPAARRPGLGHGHHAYGRSLDLPRFPRPPPHTSCPLAPPSTAGRHAS